MPGHDDISIKMKNACEPASTDVETDSLIVLLLEHDLIRKPVSTFRDHALGCRA
jgi:hypothetical protein